MMPQPKGRRHGHQSSCYQRWLIFISHQCSYVAEVFLRILKQRFYRQQNVDDTTVGSLVGDKLQFMNTNCGNAAETWTQKGIIGNIILLTVQSDRRTKSVLRSAGQLRTRYHIKGFRPSAFGPRQYYGMHFKLATLWSFKVCHCLAGR